MSDINNNAINSVNNYSSEDDVLVPMVNKKIEGTLDSGGRFFGVLEGFSEFQLFIRGYRGQQIIVKRRKVAWMEAI